MGVGPLPPAATSSRCSAPVPAPRSRRTQPSSVSGRVRTRTKSPAKSCSALSCCPSRYKPLPFHRARMPDTTMAPTERIHPRLINADALSGVKRLGTSVAPFLRRLMINPTGLLILEPGFCAARSSSTTCTACQFSGIARLAQMPGAPPTSTSAFLTSSSLVPTSANVSTATSAVVVEVVVGVVGVAPAATVSHESRPLFGARDVTVSRPLRPTNCCA